MDVLIGFGIAVVISLTGVGAGVITAPLLILFMHVPIEIAVSTALAYSAVVKLIIVPAQIWRKQVAYRVLGYMLLGGLPGVIIGSLLFKHVAAYGPRSFLYAVLGAIIIFSSGWHVYRHFFPSAADSSPQPNPSDRSSQSRRSKWLTAIMLPIGAEVGFSSSGAGALGSIALLSLTSLTAAQVVGTDLTFGLCIATVGSGIHAIGGAYNIPLLLKLCVGGVLGGVLGTSAAPRIPNRQLRLALSLWLLAIGIEFCYQAVRVGPHAAVFGLNSSVLR